MNWHERIARGIRHGGFTGKDKSLAANWVTCACGNQDPRIPRDDEHAPIDDQLDIKAQHVRRLAGIVLDAIIAALAQYVQ